MSKIDWNKAPDWATCVVINNTRLNSYYWCETQDYRAKLQHVTSNISSIMLNPTQWTVVEHRPTLVYNRLIMTPKAGRITYEQFIAGGWDDEQLIESGYATRINCRCVFTPVEQPSTAPDLLNQAAQLLAERGQQYDKEGEERSSAAIVAAFNAITKRDLTPGEGWLFMVLLKAVRFYSNTETPHRDSLEDMIAYTALHAEEYLNDK